MKEDQQEEDNEMRPEYDFSKLKLVGRGIYAERYRAGVKFFVVNDKGCLNESDDHDDQCGER